MITRFRSRDAALAAAERLSRLVPGHDYEAWPDRGCWVLVTRYRDDDGHIRFKFVRREDGLSKKHNMQEKTRAPELNPPASGKPEPPRRNPQERPVANNIGDARSLSERCSDNDVTQKMAQAFPGQRSRHVFKPERGFTPSAVLANPSRA